MKVCVTGLRGIPHVMGGVEMHCQQLYPRLKQRLEDTEFEILARAPYVTGGPRVFDGVRVTPLASPRNKYLEAICHTVVSVFYARLVAKADVLHIHAVGPGVLAPLARLAGMRVVFTHHGADYKRAKWNGLAKLVLRVGERLALRNADRVIVVALSLARDLRRENPSRADDIHYIPNGIDRRGSEEAEGRRNVLARFGLAPSSYVLAVGRLVPEKGLHTLIAAVNQLGSPVRLVIAGAADHDSEYSRQLLTMASDRIVFAGQMRSNELAELYVNAAIFVLPSTHEGLPLAALEAISHSAPVILSDIPPNRDLGLPDRNYVPPEDVEALKAKLREQADSLRVPAAEFAEKFDWDAIADQTADLYRGLRRP
jgi:glycosyltransferase involved in cell wall biosynthesis